MTVMGEQLNPTSTLSSVRSSPRIAPTADAVALADDTMLSQRSRVLGVLTGGTTLRVVGVAAARVCAF
jgi:hypothetical protein